MVWHQWSDGGRIFRGRIHRQRPALDGFLLPWCRDSFLNGHFWPRLHNFLFSRSRIVEGKFYPYFSRVSSFAVELVPSIILTATWNDKLVEFDPGFTYQVGLSVIIENRNLQLIVIRGIVDGKA